ncbi:MAG: ChaN family lipoprotein, partial [Bdellovibrionaceae bacterium]|nr:ChaN family lipoprotein [Pseudobdellovibrionaceae bacterium]
MRSRLGSDPADLHAYTVEGRGLLRRKYRVSSKSEILAEIDSADVVYGGDFHAHGPAQRTHLKILRHLAVERPVILALECFEARAQKWIDAYLSGRFDLSTLKARAKWDESWGFPWEQYRPLVELAKKKNWKIEAIGVPKEGTVGRGGLARQDRETAKRLRHLVLTRPAALIYVIIGELHLSRLPAVFRKEMGRVRRLR